MDIKYIQQEMAFFIVNAEMTPENLELLVNLEHKTILDIV